MRKFEAILGKLWFAFLDIHNEGKKFKCREIRLRWLVLEILVEP